MCLTVESRDISMVDKQEEGRNPVPAIHRQRLYVFRAKCSKCNSVQSRRHTFCMILLLGIFLVHVFCHVYTHLVKMVFNDFRLFPFSDTLIP